MKRDIAKLRAALTDHLESAQAIADELGEPFAAYMVGRALDELRAGDLGRLRHAPPGEAR